MSEAGVQQRVRIAASEIGWTLFRNNVGVLRDERGVPVRFGLANESSAQNKIIKSGDLIGIRPILITQDMVGQVIGQFVSLECKHEKWRYTGTVHEEAQAKWRDLVRSMGGYADFTTGAIDNSFNSK